MLSDSRCNRCSCHCSRLRRSRCTHCSRRHACGSAMSVSYTHLYTVLYSRQPATLNYLVCSADPDLYHGTQCIDTLVELSLIHI